MRSTIFPVFVSTPAEAPSSSAVTARYSRFVPFFPDDQIGVYQVFRFESSKNASLFAQRKNPRKIAWTQVYRRMHKKGITEEVAKKRSRRTVKHQRGIVGADLNFITARRNQASEVRNKERTAAIAKAKSAKKEKEAKKAKVNL